MKVNRTKLWTSVEISIYERYGELSQPRRGLSIQKMWKIQVMPNKDKFGQLGLAMERNRHQENSWNSNGSLGTKSE